MWSPSESSSRRARPRQNSSTHDLTTTSSDLVGDYYYEASSRQADSQREGSPSFPSTSASASAAVLSPPRRSLSYEDNLFALASASSSTPIPSPSTLRTQRPLAAKRSNLTSSTPASPAPPSDVPTPLRSHMLFAESRRPSTSNTNVPGSRRSSATRSPDAAAALLAASKYDMKRMLAKPAQPISSSFSSSSASASAGSVGILSAASRNEDDLFNSATDIDPLAYGSSLDTTSRSYLRNGNSDSMWTASGEVGLGGGGGGNAWTSDVMVAATRTRSRNESPSTSSSSAAPQHQQHPYAIAGGSPSPRNPPPHRARGMTQASTSTNYHPPPTASTTNTTSYFADYSVDSHSAYAPSTSTSSRSRVVVPPQPPVTFPSISDDVVPPLSSPMSKSSSSPGPRALTPASAIAFAYQQQQQLRVVSGSGSAGGLDSSRRPTPSPSPSSNPSFYAASSSEASVSEQHHQQQQQQYLNTPFASMRTLGGGTPPEQRMEKSRSSSGLRTLSRKVSGKFSTRKKKSMGPEETMNVGSSYGTNEGSYLASAAGEDFGGYEGDDNSTGGFGGSGRSRSQYDVSQSQRRSYADGMSPDASLPASPVSPPIPSTPSSANQRQSKLTKTKSLLRLSQQNRSATDPTPAATQEPPTPGGGGVGGSIWKIVKKFSSSTLREKHRAGPAEAVPPVPALPPGVGGGSVSRRSSVSDHDYGVVVGGGGFGGFGVGVGGRDEGPGGRYSISSSSVVSKPKSEAKRSIIGRSRSGTVVSSAQSHGMPVRVPDLPTRAGPRSPTHTHGHGGHGHNRSLSQSRTTTTATLSSSPISSDLSSSRYFFGRQQSSPRTSTSSYLAYSSDVQDYGPPPPLPVQQKSAKHIVPPDDLFAAMLQYGDNELGGGREEDDAASSNYHTTLYSSAASRKSVASSGAQQKGSGLSAPPSRRSTDRSRSRDPPPREPQPQAPSSRKSSASGKGEVSVVPPTNSGSGELRGRLPMASMSSSSLSAAPAKTTKPKKVGNFQHPPLMRPRVDNSAPASRGGAENVAKASPVKRKVLHRLMKSKSEINLNPPPADTSNPPTPPTARPLEDKDRRRTSPPVPSPSSPTKRWSVDERRGSAGSGNLLNVNPPLSPTRAASFDLPRSRPPSFSTTVMFRDITEVPATRRTEDEKNRMWDMLLEKSEKAGGTLHAKIDSSIY